MFVEDKFGFSISNDSSADVSSDADAPTSDSRPWHARFIRFGPLAGLSGMLLAIASLAISLGILVGSDGAQTSDWSAPPSTYLGQSSTT